MKRLINIRINKNEWVSFVLTLIATLVGVLIAILLTNSGVKNKEEKDTIKLLHTAKIILLNTNEYSNGLYNTMLEFEKDSIKYTKEKIESLKAKNPIPYPDLLETLISNELVSKNTSEFTHNYIYSNLINLRKLSSYETAEYYSILLDEMITTLDLEIELLKGKIDINELKTKFELKSKEIKNKYSTKNVLEIKKD